MRVAFGFFFVVQVRDFNFASVTFDHELKKCFVVADMAISFEAGLECGCPPHLRACVYDLHKLNNK